jgi:hypothetical protein
MWIQWEIRLNFVELGISGSKNVIWHPASIGQMLKTDACMFGSNYMSLAKCRHTTKGLWTAEAMLQLSQPKGASMVVMPGT